MLGDYVEGLWWRGDYVGRDLYVEGAMYLCVEGTL